MTALRVIIAPDSFKGTMTAHQAGAAMKAGWLAVRPGDEVTVVAMADGGEGTLDIVHAASPGSTIVPVGNVTGPDGSPTPSHYAALPNDTALVELATGSGITLMNPLDAWGATTAGLGETIARALDDGMEHVVVALGGSASTDAGLGALQALGLRAITDDSNPLGPGAHRLHRIVSFDTSDLRKAPEGITVLRDTTATFLEAPGIFGPQKGASPGDVERLEAHFHHLVATSGDTSHHLEPGSGAAGGTGWGLSFFAGAHIVDGAQRVADLVGLTALCDEADVVITGEGRFDQTSLTGKVTGAVISLATDRGLPVGVIAGVVDLVTSPGVVTASLADAAGGGRGAMAEPERWAESSASEMAQRMTGT
jgi:glycerate kinase